MTKKSNDSKSRKPWLTLPHVWKSEAAFMSWMRSGIRRSLWSNSPLKLEFLKLHKKRIPNPNKRGTRTEVFGATCEMCGKDYPLKDIEIDHRQGNNSLRSVDDIQSFIEGIVMVNFDDLAVLCKPCHKIKTFSERTGVSIEDAKAEKEAIAICKAKKDKSFLEERGIVPASTAAKRRIQIEEYLKNE